MPSRAGLFVFIFTLAALVFAGCTGDDEEPTPTTAPPSPTAAARPTSTATTVPTPALSPTSAPTVLPAPTPTAMHTGTLEVRVTDLPSATITAIEVTVEDIEVHRSSDGAWVSVVEGPVTFDLIALAGVEELLGSSELTPGEYTQIRLKVMSTTVTDDGEMLDAQVPGETLRIVRPFDIVDGETTIATLDFDAEQSVVTLGTGTYHLRPVVKLLVRKEGEPFQPKVRPTATATPDPTLEFFLHIEEPETVEAIVAESSITVVGRTRIDAAVSVGDTFAELDEEGRFRVPVQLEEGPNFIEVIASLESGEELVEILVIIYSP